MPDTKHFPSEKFNQPISEQETTCESQIDARPTDSIKEEIRNETISLRF